MSLAHDFPALHQQLAERLIHARRQSDALFEVVHPGALYERPIPERHRIIFYVGHLEAFDWNLLHERVLGLKSFQSEFDKLFAFGIDPVGGGLPNDQPSDWPSPAQVNNYVAAIRKTLDKNLEALISEADFNERSYDGFALSTYLNVAIEHRLMHVETLSYMLHQLRFDQKIAPNAYSEPLNSATTFASSRMLHIPAGTVTLGLTRAGGEFGWDNEFEAHTVDVSAFAVDEYKVTNRQYSDFIASGGYDVRQLWGDDDWQWKTEHNISHPVFWNGVDKNVNHPWALRTMFREIALPLDWPVYVSQAEARAYAKWAGKSLPTEAEWQRAASGASPIEKDPASLIADDPDPGRWDPAPVQGASRASAFGVRDLYGNGWEWTSTVFSPFPGFEPFPFYRGYSADFFDGKHFVMKGGSPRTAACMLRPSFRNWFQSHYQYVYAGFRCVSR
jgi:gamma-glutamyl hercynylcysteine S-oxide synthase